MRIVVPEAGLDRSNLYHRQPPYTTPGCLNVFPLGALPGRRMLGSRPGAKRYLEQSLPNKAASGSPINMAGIVSFTQTVSRRWVVDDAQGYDVDGDWRVPAAFTKPTIDTEQHFYYGDYSGSTKYGLIRGNPTGVDTNIQQIIDLGVVPWRRLHRGKYTFYVGLDTSNPSPGTEGVRIEVTIGGTGDTVTVVGYHNTNTLITPTGSVSPYVFGWNDFRRLRLYWTLSGAATAYNLSLYADEIEVWSYTTPAFAVPGTLVGWSMQPTASGDRTIVDYFYWNYPTTSTYSHDLHQAVFAANGSVCYESAGNDFTKLTNLTVNSDVQLQCVQLYGKLYIADYGSAFATTTTDVTLSKDGSNRITITSAATNFANEGVTTSHGVILTSLGTGTPSGANLSTSVAYKIHSVSGTTITLSRTSAQSFAGHGANASVYCQRVPKVYDPATNTIDVLTTGNTADTTALGSVPLGCPMIEEFGARLVFAGGTTIYASRVNDPIDYDYAKDAADPTSAWATTLADVGKMPLNVTCIAAVGEDFLLASSQNKLFRFRGDPAYNGDIRPFAHDVGVIAPRAICRTPSGQFYFMARSGLYRMDGVGSLPVPLSAGRLPQELYNLNRYEIGPMLVWAQDRNAVLIFNSGISQNQRIAHYLFDVAADAFWPFTLHDNSEPMSVVNALGYFNKENRTLIGGRDGHVRALRRFGVKDQNNDIVSFVTLGPFRAEGSATADTILDSIVSVLDMDSDTAVLNVYTGDVPQEAVRNAVAETNRKYQHNLSRGVTTGIYPRVRGGAICLRVNDSSASRWKLSELEAEIVPGGPHR